MSGNFVTTYGDVSIKDDVVLNAIEILTATESQVMNMLPKSRAIATVHSYLTDTLRTAASLAASEEADFAPASGTTPTRFTNVVEKVVAATKVSRTQQRVDHYHGQNELMRQQRKALLDWGNAFEFDLVRSTLASGVSGTAPKMEGIIAHTSKSSNHTSHTSGTAFNATILDGLLKNQWVTSNGKVSTDLLMSAGTKRSLDDATQKSNIVVNSPNGVQDIVHMTTSYTTSFGRLMTHAHRYVYQTGDATDRIMAINRDQGAVAWLQAPFVDNGVARSGDYDIFAVVGEGTFECHNKDSFFYADGFLIV